MGEPTALIGKLDFGIKVVPYIKGEIARLQGKISTFFPKTTAIVAQNADPAQYSARVRVIRSV